MKSNFNVVLDYVFEHEGGYTNDAADAGGPTNYGITIFDVSEFLGRKATAADVKKLTKTQARGIYRNKYWDKMAGDELPAGVDYAVVDFGINSGVSRSVKYTQRIVGVVDDGRMGPVTVAAIQAYDPVKLINELLDRREQFLREVIAARPSQAVFRRGWFRRTAEVRRNALAMVVEKPAPKPAPSPEPKPAPAPVAEAPKSFWRRLWG